MFMIDIYQSVVIRLIMISITIGLDEQIEAVGFFPHDSN